MGYLLLLYALVSIIITVNSTIREPENTLEIVLAKLAVFLFWPVIVIFTIYRKARG